MKRSAAGRLRDIAARPEGLSQKGLLLIVAEAPAPPWPRDQRRA